MYRIKNSAYRYAIDLKLEKFCGFLACITLLFASGMLMPQDANAEDTASLAKTIQNPIANMVSLPLQANYNKGVEPYDRTFFNLNIQPVIPFPGKKMEHHLTHDYSR